MIESPIYDDMADESTTDHDDDNLDHFYCYCNPDISLCGRDISDANFVDFEAIGPEDCVVCIDLIPVPCPRCGHVS